MAAPRKEGKQSSETKTVLMWQASQGLRGAWQLAIRLIWGQRLCSASGCHTPLPSPGGAPVREERGGGAGPEWRPQDRMGLPAPQGRGGRGEAGRQALSGPEPEGWTETAGPRPGSQRGDRGTRVREVACPGSLVCGGVGAHSHLH